MADMKDTGKMQPPKDMSHHLSQTTRRRPYSAIKSMYRFFAIPHIGQIGGGLPNTHNFPFDKFEATVAVPDRFRPTPNRPVDPPSTAAVGKKHLKSTQLSVPQESGIEDRPHKIDLSSALQYGTAQGYPPLYEWLKEFTIKHLHPQIPYAGGPDIVLSCGNTDGFGKALTALNNEWLEGRDSVADKEGLLVEAFAYMAAVQAAAPRGMNVVPVAMDAEGMTADGEGGLEEVLKNWDWNRGKRPHLMYTVTMGQNPTGGLLSLQRRKAIYKLCQEYDIIIIEDDPYWYLQYPSGERESGLCPKRTNDSQSLAPVNSCGFDFLDSLVPSYISIDVDGRVIRLDSFSKTIAPGCRMGWITAQPVLIERLCRATEASTQQPSGFTQAMVAELLIGPQSSSDPGKGGRSDGKGWSFDGWVRWLEGLRGNYERRMTRMCDILDEGKWAVVSGVEDNPRSASGWEVVHKTALFDFVRPMAGMFVWIRITFENHPVFINDELPGPTLSTALWIYFTYKPFLVFVFPGKIFGASEEIREQDGWRFFRVCFAGCDADEVEPLTQRFVDAIHSFFKLDKDQIQQIIKDDEDKQQHESVFERADLGQLGGWAGC